MVSGEAGVRRATALVTVALCLIAVSDAGLGAANVGLWEVPMVGAMIVLPLLYVLPATRPLWLRHRYPLLAVQAAASVALFVLFGPHWPAGPSGWLAGLVLLTVPAPASWYTVVALAAVQETVQVGVIGLSSHSTANAIALGLWAVVFFAVNALMLFGLARLADLISAVHAARDELAEAAVNAERVRAADSLRAAIGDRLALAADHTAAALQTITGNAPRAREHITETAAAARQALSEVREVTARARRPAMPEALPALAAVTLAPRIARAVLAVVLCGMTLQYVVDVAGNINDMPNGSYGAAVIWWTTANAVAVAALQLRHSWPSHGSGRPRGWLLTLALQALLTYIMVPVTGWNPLAMCGFLAGSALLLLPAPADLIAFAAVVASVPALWVIRSWPGMTPVEWVGALVLLTTGAVALGLMVYGLTRLAWLAAQLENLRGALAREAVADERLRVARDTHDLLGLGLSAIAMKSDLIGKLIGRDDARAGEEIAELARICAAARADVRLVAGEARELPLAAELVTARGILASAGIDVRLLVDGDPTSAAASVLVPVVREAVTNILRHSSAACCTIELTADGAGQPSASVPGVPTAAPCRQNIRLSISNDGAVAEDGYASPSGDRNHTGNVAAGAGLRNLTARLGAAGGKLTSNREDGRFVLSVELPQ